MEIKNGIIIDGVLHEAVQYKINCKRCSLLSVCYEFNAVCAVIGCEAFVERGKVTVTSYYRETPKNAGEIIKNRKGFPNLEAFHYYIKLKITSRYSQILFL